MPSGGGHLDGSAAAVGHIHKHRGGVGLAALQAGHGLGEGAVVDALDQDIGIALADGGGVVVGIGDVVGGVSGAALGPGVVPAVAVEAGVLNRAAFAPLVLGKIGLAGGIAALVDHITGLGGGLDGHLAVFNGEQLHLGAALVVQLEQLDLGLTGPALGQGPGGGTALVVPVVDLGLLGGAPGDEHGVAIGDLAAVHGDHVLAVHHLGDHFVVLA